MTIAGKAVNPISQYPPLTLRYGMVRMYRHASDAAMRRSTAQGAARAFDVIALTGAQMLPQAVLASEPVPWLYGTCILDMNGWRPVICQGAVFHVRLDVSVTLRMLTSKQDSACPI